MQVLGAGLGHGGVDEQGQQDLARGGTKAGAQRTDHGQGGTLFQIIRHGGGHGAVGDVDGGIQHAVQNVGDVRVDEVLVLGKAGNLDKRQHEDDGQRY